MVLRGVLAALLHAAPVLLLASDVAVSNGAVVPGEWNANFSAVLEVARREHRPMLLVHTSEGCPLCARLNQAIDGEAVYRWQQDRKLLMAYVRTGGTDADREEINAFVKSVSDGLSGFPQVCVYWPKPDGTTNGVAFVGRRGQMGTEKEELLSVEFMTAVDQSLKDYLAQDVGHATIDQIVSKSTKKISVTKIGAGGSVAMEPASGVLPEGGKVVLDAKAASDSLFVGWFDPEGHAVGWGSRLVVSGRMPTGTYSAKFRPKDECPPPVLTTVSTSLCVQVGRKFSYVVPVEQESRPVHFRIAGQWPKGFRFNKTLGELSGVPRKEGVIRVVIAVIGSDKGNTVKHHSVDLKIEPKKQVLRSAR